MSFPAYPAYKSSGVEWLGEVPEHWTVIALKWLSPVFRGASPRPIDDPIYFDDDGEFGWVRIADVTASPDGYLYETTQRLSALGSSLSVKLEPGELFLSIAGSVGKPCITAVKACIHDGFVYFPWLSIDQRLLYRVFESGLCFGGLGKMGTQLNLNTDTVGGICIAVPPAAELTRALAFLDHETARIDALIDEQQRLIELLKEKRQALISQAVTKGLDPTVPMKDSGVEWLGEVPAHWEVCKLSFRYSVELGKMLDEKKNIGANPLPYLRNQDVQWGVINIDSLPLIDIEPSEYERYTVRLGDLLVCEGGDVGRAAIWRYKDSIIGYQKALHRLRPESPNRDTAEFFFYSLMAAKAQGVFDESDTKATISHLPAEKFRQYRFAFPPIDDQQEIASVLGGRLKRSSETISYAENTIAILQERRSALISAAVTGKIDVRGWQPPASAPTPELAQEAV
ncbi:restriction endonuclease subunit S [Pseudomonas sp. WS 5011]|uniref:restriction endonuclease subunit S n=1 Tax=Pseudomonas sp. WS 5011 TaxID=2717477 RepID=UPI00147421B5|nr:restriction endonuclease subunit S [Pseudomonas sp. WS 5011]MBX9763300.1 restriction endonuclease subunit S [Pseudomonadaceae bacterium]NMY51432.1 restriction endonuclease subunit S [Pseudomonas sp. WS 5011]